MAEGKKLKNELVVVGRETLSLDGVHDILAFDTNFALLSTELGVLTVEGEALHIEKTDVQSGILVLNGHIDSLVYSDDQPSRKKGLFGRRG